MIQIYSCRMAQIDRVVFGVYNLLSRFAPVPTSEFNRLISPSASLIILLTSVSHDGMSLIRPTVIPALRRQLHKQYSHICQSAARRERGMTDDQIPASGSPSSYTFLPL